MDENTLRSAGIDYDAALARFVGKHAIYEKYLLKFLDDTHAAEAMRAYEQKDYAQVQEQTHALKGVAGTLGLTALFEICSGIVQDLRNDVQDGLELKLERMVQEQERLHAVLRQG